MKKHAVNNAYYIAIILMALGVTLCGATSGVAGVTANFQYMLSDLSGTIPSQWARLDVDQHFREIYPLNQAGILESFGRSGSGPGKFGVVAGIAGDEHGNIYVSHRLRSVVMVFDHTFEFLGEFGYRGSGEENLIVPDDIAVDGTAGKVYVGQAANRDVSVFRLVFP